MLFPDSQTHRLPVGRDGQAPVEMAYEDRGPRGADPTLLLLHGLFDSRATWTFLAARLAARYRLVAPDLVGCGESDRPLFRQAPEAWRYSAAMHVEYLAALVEALDLDAFAVVGNSLGGGLALRLYLDHPQVARRIGGLVLVDAAGYPQELPGYVREMGGPPGRLLLRPAVQALAWRSGLVEWSVRRTFRRSFCDPGKIPETLVHRALEALRRPNAFYAHYYAARNILPPDYEHFHRRFGQIACPALVFWGREDCVLNPLSALRFEADLPDAELHVLEDCGHAPQLERPDDLAAHLETWMQRRVFPTRRK